MTVTYAFMSIICGVLCAAFAWIESGPLWAAITYVFAGSIALLAMAFHVSTAGLQDAGVLDRKGVKPSRHGAAG